MTYPYPVEVHMSRSSNGMMHLRVMDTNSRACIDVEMTLEDFAKALTSMPAPGQADYQRVEMIGKKKITEQRTAEYPGEVYDNRDTQEAWLCKNKQEEGWTLNYQLRMQDSVVRDKKTKKTILRYSVTKWV